MTARYVCHALTAAAVVYGSRLRKSLATGGEHTDYSVKMSNFNNVQYSAPFQLDDQSIPVIYDTGSFEIIVLSTLCHQCSNEHVLYDSKKSSSFASAGGIKAEHLFGSGPVRSVKGFETAALGTSASPFHVQHMPFWQVTSHDIAVWDQYSHFSGIVGMGHPSHIPEGFSAEGNHEETMLSRMGVQTFGICLERAWAGAPGWLMFGPTVDAQSAQNPAFKSMAVVGKAHWGVNMHNFQIENHPELEDPCKNGCGVIVDSGTSLIAVPPSAYNLVDALTGLIESDCSNIHALPVLRFQLDTVDIELPPKAYVMKAQTKVLRNSTVWDWLWKGPKYETQDECFAAFMSVDKMSQYGPIWIMGMPFLRYYYTIFDRGQTKIHVAECSSACEVIDSDASFWNTSTWLHNTTMRVGANGSVPMPAAAGGGMSANAGSEGGFHHHHRSFAAVDFEPNVVDLSEIRLPDWAKIKGGKHDI